MVRSRCHIVDSDDAHKRLDSVLQKHGLYSSRSQAARAIENGEVLVNSLAANKSKNLLCGDVIVCRFEERNADIALKGEEIDLDIRFEDDAIIVLSKQPGLVCHPCQDHRSATLVNALINHCGKENLCNIQGSDDRLGIVHRLDRDTSGLMLAAKTDKAGKILMDDIRARSVDRRYIALVHGIIAHDSGMIDAPIARASADRTRMAVRDIPTAREAITSFRVLERFEQQSSDNGYSLLECKLFTGRTHQIRVHMQYIHHPVVGDPHYCSYAPASTTAGLGLERQFLHSCYLDFIHPLNDSELEFSDNLPQDLMQIYDSLTSRSLGKTTVGDEIFSRIRALQMPAIKEAAHE